MTPEPPRLAVWLLTHWLADEWADFVVGDAWFQRIEDWVEPTWPGGAHPQQFHLDLAVERIADAEPAVLAAGARRHEHQPAEKGGFVVYLDPAGHPFCLVGG